MRTFTAKSGLAIGIVLTALTFEVTGCASRNQANQDPAPSDAAMQKAGASMQEGGIMSQSDYVRIDKLAHTVSQTHTISNADLDWTVAQLNAEKNSIARARAFNTLSEIRPMSSQQRAKILPAITPYLTDADSLDQRGAQRVQKAAQAGS